PYLRPIHHPSSLPLSLLVPAPSSAPRLDPSRGGLKTSLPPQAASSTLPLPSTSLSLSRLSFSSCERRRELPDSSTFQPSLRLGASLPPFCSAPAIVNHPGRPPTRHDASAHSAAIAAPCASAPTGLPHAPARISRPRANLCRVPRDRVQALDRTVALRAPPGGRNPPPLLDRPVSSPPTVRACMCAFFSAPARGPFPAIRPRRTLTPGRRRRVADRRSASAQPHSRPTLALPQAVRRSRPEHFRSLKSRRALPPGHPPPSRSSSAAAVAATARGTQAGALAG
ncbi:proline-rich receptor-like protein kinase PERK9, partial [Ananas comosus]|uniref:Proline-rich receptor-like protein kinase PERK9 n=1 Tax=Ananas comosus TaxID=4615 RepID=A0A6P5EAH0_ANACO